MPPARHTYSCHRPRERVTHPPRRHLPCNIVQCACCLITTQSRSRTALNAARSAYLLVSPPEREGHPPPSASPALQYRAMCMLSDYHAVTLPYCSECRPARHTYSCHRLRERVTHPPRRHLPCNIVQCACCLTTTQSRSRTALNAARSAYLLVSPPEREGHSPPSASLALQYRAMCMLSDYHAVTLPYCSECRPLGIPTRVTARERGSLTPLGVTCLAISCNVHAV